MTLVLFDIDMTLVDSAGAGRQALNEAFNELYGVSQAFEGVRFHGRTDAFIVKEAFARHRIDGDRVAPLSEAFVDVYIGHLSRALAERSGRVLPGARELLEALISTPEVEVGLATGNFRRGAESKLAHYGLFDLVRHGGFGDTFEERGEVIEAAARYFGVTANTDDASWAGVFVVGDTALEVTAAKQLGFIGVGVATGFDTVADLEAADADLVLDDLANTSHVTESMAALSGFGADPPRESASIEAPTVDERYEVEAKFAIVDATAIEELLARTELAGAFKLGDVRSTKLMDTYYDTWDRALLRRGLSLRVRTDAHRTRVTVKGLQNLGAGKVHRRLEQETSFGPVVRGDEDEVDVLDPQAWPEEMRSTIAAVTGPEPEFLPLCHVGHDRHYRDVFAPVATPEAHWDHAVAPMGEMCVEDVFVYRTLKGDAASSRGEPVATYSELELELASGGSMEALDSIVDWLAEQPALASVSDSKLQRGLRLVASHPPGYAASESGVQPDMPMAEAGRLIWRRQLVEMLLNEAGSRQGADIEFVHDMRVSTRRARASGVLFSEWFKPKKIDRFVKGLRTCGRRLGAVRDLDVALQKLDKYARDCPKDERKELKALAKHWRRMRRRAYVGLLDWLDSGEYRRFISKFDTFCATPGKGARAIDHQGAATPYQVRHVMPMAIFDRYVAVRAYETVLEGDGAIHVAESTLHALRIECKYLRYALEMVRHLLGEEGEVMIKQLKKLQDHLGDFNDAVVTRDGLRKIEKKGVGGTAVTRYIEVQNETAKRLREDFPPVWQSFVEDGNRAQLLRALSRL